MASVQVMEVFQSMTRRVSVRMGVVARAHRVERMKSLRFWAAVGIIVEEELRQKAATRTRMSSKGGGPKTTTSFLPRFLTTPKA